MQEPMPSPLPPLPPIGEENAPPLTPEEIKEQTEIFSLLRRIRRLSYFEDLYRIKPGRGKVPGEMVNFLKSSLEITPEHQWRERTVASWALGQSRPSPEQMPEVVRALGLALEEKKSTRSGRMFERLARGMFRVALPIYGGLFLLFAAIAVVISFMSGLSTLPAAVLGVLLGTLLLGTLLTILLSPFLAPLSVAYDMTCAGRVRTAAANALGRLRDPRGVGALAKASGDLNSAVRHAAENALRATLPYVTPELYGKLGSETVPNLCRLLSGRPPFYVSPEEQRLKLLVLDALTVIGDSRAIPTVQRIAELEKGPCQRTAQQALAVLLERQQHERDQSMLLRGSAAPMTAPDHLLRPVQSTPETPSEQLLRAVQSGDASYPHPPP